MTSEYRNDQNTQQSLFGTRSYHSVSDGSSDYISMSLAVLQQWQHRIRHYQQQIQLLPPRQTSLFPMESSHCDSLEINPFTLPMYPEDFYRIPADRGDACIYFVIDQSLPLLLYVGETIRSHRRWQGVHDCKHYIQQYRSVHLQHQLTVPITLSFWWDAPLHKRARQHLEKELILRWKSPFNQENWTTWQTPFVPLR